MNKHVILIGCSREVRAIVWSRLGGGTVRGGEGKLGEANNSIGWG